MHEEEDHDPDVIVLPAVNERAAASAKEVVNAAIHLNDTERRFAEAIIDPDNVSWVEAAAEVWPKKTAEQHAALACKYMQRDKVRDYLDAMMGCAGFDAVGMLVRGMLRLEILATKESATDRIRLDANVAVCRLAGDCLAAGIKINGERPQDGPKALPEGREPTADDLEQYDGILSGDFQVGA